jgi:hypothetical protein
MGLVLRRFVTLVAPVTLAGVVSTLPAFAQATDNEAWDGGFNQKAERRSDLVLGASAGLLLGTTSGYPNELDKIDVSRYEASTGFAAGTAFSFWLGGALTDWFTFGVGTTLLGGSGPSGKMNGLAFIVKVEAFPLYGKGGPFRDLAFFADFGAGSMGVDGERPDPAEGGFTSVAGLGSAYELFRLGHFSFAPTAQYLFVNSPSLTSHSAILGARAVFYGGPSGKQRVASASR